MACLIVAESAIFIIFVVAYLFYLGKSLTGPTPRDRSSIFPSSSSICLLSSSIHRTPRGLRSAQAASASALLGLARHHCSSGQRSFSAGPPCEWYKLIYRDGLTMQTNLFGTTFYSLVGLHATHVLVGLVMLSLALNFFPCSSDSMTSQEHTEPA
jgi:cytochrome c oxidase subunit 3